MTMLDQKVAQIYVSTDSRTQGKHLQQLRACVGEGVRQPGQTGD
jgi:hypothetical protein